MTLLIIAFLSVSQFISLHPSGHTVIVLINNNSSTQFLTKILWCNAVLRATDGYLV